MKSRLDLAVVQRGLVSTRSQAESYIKLGQVTVNTEIINKPGFLVSKSDSVKLNANERYVSRAGLKLASVAEALKLDFRDKIVLDVGSSTGGFTDYALQHGAMKVIAVDVGTGQLAPNLRADHRVEVHEKTDIRDFWPSEEPDIVLADVSFISLQEILPHLSQITNPKSQIVVMAKPQFEAGGSLKNRGVIKNDTLRREILKNFEIWTKQHFIIDAKADSEVTGAKGNRERFYSLRKLGD
jgi:23S rRNA (cytidine1920-2'-O)/16S rRNA (cytidine1409-2'-O)-methyltransferase